MDENEIDSSSSSPRQAVKVTVRAGLIEQAKALQLDLSDAAEAGIKRAIRAAKGKAWLEENQDAIKACSERVARERRLIHSVGLDE